MHGIDQTLRPRAEKDGQECSQAANVHPSWQTDGPHMLYQQSESGMSDSEKDADPGWHHLILACCCLILPNGVVVLYLSDIGYGMATMTHLATPWIWYVACGCKVLSLFLAVVFYVCSLESLERREIFFAAAVVVYALWMFGSSGLAHRFPEAPLAAVLFQLPVALGICRATVVGRVKTARAAFWACVLFLAMSAVLLVLWLLWVYTDLIGGEAHPWDSTLKADLANRAQTIYSSWTVKADGYGFTLDYLRDCKRAAQHRDKLSVSGAALGLHDETVVLHLDKEEEEQMAAACGVVAKTWFLLYISPVVASAANFVLAIFAWLSKSVHEANEGLGRTESLLKWFVLLMGGMLFVMWVAVSITGSALRLTGSLFTFVIALGLVFAIWTYIELRQKIARALQNSAHAQSIHAVIMSDWFWSAGIIGFNFCIILICAIDCLKQKVRRNGETFSPWLQKIITLAEEKRYVSLMLKVNILCELYFLFSIGVAKATLVFLSFLNEALMSLSLGAVTGIFFVIGFLLFMAPPVPGIPVYICSGIVISSRASTTVLGYEGGIGLAIAISFVLKLTAVAGQYLIGYTMGKWVKVQQMVGVDKIAIRAVEKILRHRGLSLSKAVVLVGGPDWPTSVLCGILRLSLPQCILGTVPVILVSSPCVIAGALLVPPAGADASKFTTASSMALILSAIAQIISGFSALYFTQEVIVNFRSELEEHRPEHQPVKDLTEREKEYVSAFQDVTAWKNLSRCQKLLISLGTVVMLGTVVALAVLDEVFFRAFDLSHRIGWSYARGGLNGSVFNIVKFPGYIALSCFAFACFLHLLFARLAVYQAGHMLQRRKVAPEPCHGVLPAGSPD